MWGRPPPPPGGGNPETHENVKKSRGTMKSEGAELSHISAVGVRTYPPTRSWKGRKGPVSAHHRGMEGGGADWAAPMPKKWGGGKEAVASVEPGWPREAAQVSGFRGAGNNSSHLFLKAEYRYCCQVAENSAQKSLMWPKKKIGGRRNLTVILPRVADFQR